MGEINHKLRENQAVRVKILIYSIVNIQNGLPKVANIERARWIPAEVVHGCFFFPGHDHQTPHSLLKLF